MRILLVDDNEISLELQKLMIESCKITVDTATGGEAAIELVKKNSYDLIFMDINMPQMDGFTAFKHIREIDKRVKGIALSADEVLEQDERFKASGMNSSVLKPLDRQTLLGILSDYELSRDIKKTPKRRKKSDVIFDYDALRESIGSNSEVLHVLQQFLGLHHNDCELIEKYVARGDYLSARKILHNIIGISGNLNCMRLYNISVTLSQQLNAEKSDCIGEFARVWRMTVGELSEQCGRLLLMFRSEESTGNWNTLWNDFINACEDFDVSASRLFLSNREKFEKYLGHETAELLRKAVTEYDFVFITDNKEKFNV